MNEKRLKEKNSPIPKPKNNEGIAKMDRNRKKEIEMKKK